MRQLKHLERVARVDRTLPHRSTDPDLDDFHLELDGSDSPVGSGTSVGADRCGTEWRMMEREELETDGRKRQLLLDLMGQLTLADLLDGTA